MLWYIGNTSVTQCFSFTRRIGCLIDLTLQGNIRGTAGDIAFRELLGQYGIVSLGTDVTNSAGRNGVLH